MLSLPTSSKIFLFILLEVTLKKLIWQKKIWQLDGRYIELHVGLRICFCHWHIQMDGLLPN